jgi:hypothetical protein
MQPFFIWATLQAPAGPRTKGQGNLFETHAFGHCSVFADQSGLPVSSG